MTIDHSIVYKLPVRPMFSELGEFKILEFASELLCRKKGESEENLPDDFTDEGVSDRLSVNSSEVITDSFNVLVKDKGSVSKYEKQKIYMDFTEMTLRTSGKSFNLAFSKKLPNKKLISGTLFRAYFFISLSNTVRIVRLFCPG